MESLKYPIGQFQPKESYSTEECKKNIAVLETFPMKLREAVSNLTDEQLDTAYRPGGWTIRQVVHHCADSHMNSIIRFKLGLTEENPTIKPYFEDRWAELPDSKLSIDASLAILDGVHLRLSHLLTHLSDDQFLRTFHHPDMPKPVSLAQNAALYAWHSEHHLAHITELKKRKGW